MRCPVCDDEIPVSVRHCTFCNTNLDTGHRGPLVAPDEAEIVRARRRGAPLVVAGSLGIAGAIGIGAIAPLPLLELVGFVLFTSAAGVLARGIHGIATANRLAFKRRLAQERHPDLSAAGGTISPVAAPILTR